MKQNFRTIGSLVAICAMIVMAASCKKDNLREDVAQLISGVERTITTSASLPQSADKAYLDETDGCKVKWELTDALNINGTNMSLASLNADATTAKFEGTAYAIPSGSNEIYWAVYPTTLAGTYSGSIPSNFTASSLTVRFPATQTYDASANALRGNTLMAGYASVPSGEEQIVFQMCNLGSVIKLHLTAEAGVANTQANKIVFSTTDGALAGNFTVSNSTTPTITPAANAAKTITINLTDGTNNYIDISSGADVYVILPPMASKNLTISIYNTDNKCTIKTIASATLARNSFYTSNINTICFCCPDGFSVSASKRIVFAPGNLQWSATGGGTTATTHAVAGGGTAPGTWRFAEHQWDFVGDATCGNVYGVGGDMTVKCNNANTGQNYQGWIDLFGWGTSGYDNTSNDQYVRFFQPWDSTLRIISTAYNYWGYGPSTNMTDPSLVGTSANYDWGVYNAIYNPTTNATDPAGTWRTLTHDEWVYVMTQRTTCSGMRFVKATVDGVVGLIILPDNWDENTYVLYGANSSGASFITRNNISITDWGVLAAAGCVFLPAAGSREGASVINGDNSGNYWSTTYGNSSGGVYFMSYGSSTITASRIYYRCHGRSVRLVKDI